MMMSATTLDIPTVQAFLLVAELESFTRTAEVLGTTQAAVSMKLQRLEAVLRKRLVERSPRAVRLTADGTAFLSPARALIEAHERALAPVQQALPRLSLGISDHAAGPELVPLIERLHAVAPQLALVQDVHECSELASNRVHDVHRSEGAQREGGRVAPRPAGKP